MSDTREKLPVDAEQVVEQVRERYGRIAAKGGSCCSSSCSDDAPVSTRIGYDAVALESVPEEANLGLGCGAPIPHLELKPGEVVLDLGSGGGLDAFLAAPLVGSTGRVIGVDMTPEMIDRATAAAARAGHDNVEFRLGRLEQMPVDDGTVDAVTSNCVINLVPDKAAVFAEIARVLRPGGRLVVSDIVLDGELPRTVAADLMAYVGCVAGAMQRENYFGMLSAAGLGDVQVLRDIDFLSTMGDKLPPELSVEGIEFDPEEIRGKVHSVTYRARR